MPTVPIVIPFLEHVVLDQCGVSNRRDDNLTHENHNCENHKCENHKCENRQCDQTKSEIRKAKNHTNSTEKNENAKNLMHDYSNLHCCEILRVQREVAALLLLRMPGHRLRLQSLINLRHSIEAIKWPRSHGGTNNFCSSLCVQLASEHVTAA